MHGGEQLGVLRVVERRDGGGERGAVVDVARQEGRQPQHLGGQAVGERLPLVWRPEGGERCVLGVGLGSGLGLGLG